MKNKTNFSRQREKIFSAQETGEVLQELMRKGARCRFRAKGWSMSPLIKDGDIVTITPTKDCRIRVGQIVAVIEPETRRLFIHRVVRKKGMKYEIKGDNLLTSDGLFDQSEIIGLVEKIERGSRVISTSWKFWHYLMALASRSRLGIETMNFGRKVKRFFVRMRRRSDK